ncbi:uncharacterized protein LOC129592038 [Paramacrobiotus metropolitanus]|uniref:uncharacterized protein LOC129592038 n=1 Tax=Paramacrobiotus metropolitanus TaxID=2943436 RepID=UPI002445F1D6|nr:uncharacterized protein LOC129592038 [Paramacrobiotus metropolitanus]
MWPLMKHKPLMYYFAVITVLGFNSFGAEAGWCYVCKDNSTTNPTDPDVMTQPLHCPDINATESRYCGKGSTCYIFRGKQQIGGKVIENGVLRLCGNDRGDALLDSNFFGGDTCQSIFVSIHNEYKGTLCPCSGDLCNSDGLPPQPKHSKGEHLKQKSKGLLDRIIDYFFA